MNEQSTAKYSELLTSYLKIGIAIIIIAFVVFLIFFCISLKSGSIKDKGILIGLILLLLIEPTVYITSVLPYQLDIKQQAYEEYQGQFYVEDYYASRNGTYIFISYNKQRSVRYKAPSSLTEIEANATYSGKFIVSKHSKVLVDISVDEKLKSTGNS